MRELLKTSLVIVSVCFISSCNKNSEECLLPNDETEISSTLNHNEMLSVQKNIITRFYGQTRSQEELMSEEEAKQIFTPLVEDGKEICKQIQNAISIGELSLSEQEYTQLENMTDEQLAGISMVIYDLENPLIMDEISYQISNGWDSEFPFLPDEPSAYTKSQLLNCLTFALGFDAISGLTGYITGTAGLITARTAWQIVSAFVGRTLGWVGLAIAAYEYANCLNSKQ